MNEPQSKATIPEKSKMRRRTATFSCQYISPSTEMKEIIKERISVLLSTNTLGQKKINITYIQYIHTYIHTLIIPEFKSVS